MSLGRLIGIKATVESTRLNEEFKAVGLVDRFFKFGL